MESTGLDSSANDHSMCVLNWQVALLGSLGLEHSLELGSNDSSVTQGQFSNSCPVQSRPSDCGKQLSVDICGRVM